MTSEVVETSNKSLPAKSNDERVRIREGSAVLRISESEATSKAENEISKNQDPSEETRMILNMGPSHPSTHGVLRLILELEGETVERSKPVIGYLHTGMEKTAETLSYAQGSTNVTRMDYASPLFTELAFSLAVEKLLEIEVPPRATWIRMLMCELNRISLITPSVSQKSIIGFQKFF